MLPLPQRNYGNTNRKTRHNLQIKQIECNKRMANKRKAEQMDTNNDCLKKLNPKLNNNSITDRQSVPNNDNKRQRISYP